MELKVYSNGYNAVTEAVAHGSYHAGWNYPVGFDLPGLPNGTYFLRVQAGSGGQKEKGARSFKLVVLR